MPRTGLGGGAEARQAPGRACTPLQPPAPGVRMTQPISAPGAQAVGVGVQGQGVHACRVSRSVGMCAGYVGMYVCVQGVWECIM